MMQAATRSTLADLVEQHVTNLVRESAVVNRHSKRGGSVSPPPARRRRRRRTTTTMATTMATEATSNPSDGASSLCASDA